MRGDDNALLGFLDVVVGNFGEAHGFSGGNWVHARARRREVPLPSNVRPRPRTRRPSGVSLVELPCVMAIIAVLASLMLGPMAKALRKARGIAGVASTAAASTEVALAEIRSRYTAYRVAHPAHGKLSLTGFIHGCQLGPRTSEWLRLGSVTFHPFAADAPADSVVLDVGASPATGEQNVAVRVIDVLEN